MSVTRNLRAGDRGDLLRHRDRLVDRAIAGHHPLGQPLQYRELVGLAGNPCRDLVETSGHVGEFDTQIADPSAHLGDQIIFLRHAVRLHLQRHVHDSTIQFLA